MVMRKGLGRGRGKGYKNIIPQHDRRVHIASGRGIKQPQRVPKMPKIITKIRAEKLRKDTSLVNHIYKEIFKGLLVQKDTDYGVARKYIPGFGQFSLKHEDYLSGEVALSIIENVAWSRAYEITQERAVMLQDIVASDNPPSLDKKLAKMDIDILNFLAKELGFKYKFIQGKSGAHLITYTEKFKKERPKLFNKLIRKVKAK